jgi:hypothetical protein
MNPSDLLTVLNIFALCANTVALYKCTMFLMKARFQEDEQNKREEAKLELIKIDYENNIATREVHSAEILY